MSKYIDRSRTLPPINIQRYERYLPTAFDDSLTSLEKINKVIMYLHEYSAITEEMLTKWNEVYEWVMNEGLDDVIGDRLKEWIDDGTFYRIINETIFNELNNKVDQTIESFNELKNEINEKLDMLIEDFYVSIFNLGKTTFEWSV